MIASLIGGFFAYLLAPFALSGIGSLRQAKAQQQYEIAQRKLEQIRRGE